MPELLFALTDPLAAATLQAAQEFGCPVRHIRTSGTLADFVWPATGVPTVTREFAVDVTDGLQAYRLAQRAAVLLVDAGQALALVDCDPPRHGDA